jgi:glycosyltransferase involved in cell wall biosynthesis
VGSLKSYIDDFDARLGRINTVAPKVSVIVTNYNYANYIGDCLNSVSQQSYPDLECIVVDDRSNDESVERIRRFLDNDKSAVSFRLVNHDTTRGQYSAFRTGIKHATGAFIAFLDADDLLLPDFIGEHVRVHLTHPPVAFTSSNQYQIDSTGQVIGGVHPDLLTQHSYRMIGTVSLHRPFWVWATTSSMVFRRAVLDYVLAELDDAFRKCADNYVAHFCNLLGGSILVPLVLGCYRRHENNSFSKNPLIGGRLPTGDMRHHPAHDVVLKSIRRRLLDCPEQFIALLGRSGFLHTLSKVTPVADLWRHGEALRDSAVIGLTQLGNFYSIWGLLYLRWAVRHVRNRHPGFTAVDLEGSKRAAAKVTNYADYQRHRRDAK